MIELLVVIAIIAILTGIILTSLTGSKAKGRDAQRVSDIGQIQLALELYFDRCHQYPLSNSGHIDSTILTQVNANCPSGITLGSYISVINKPPVGANTDQSTNGYNYLTNANASPAVNPPTDYVLYAQLENTSSASANSLGSNSSSIPAYASSFTCDTSTHYCVGPK